MDLRDRTPARSSSARWRPSAGRALHLDLPQLHLDLGDAPGRANTGNKVMTLVASALTGGDCIDDADVLRTGGTACAPGCMLKEPSTPGTCPVPDRPAHFRTVGLC